MLVLYVIEPTPWIWKFGRGAVAIMLISAMIASLMSGTCRSAWLLGVLLLAVYVIFAMTLYLLPPQVT